MKKCLAFLMAMLCLLTLAACSNETEGEPVLDKSKDYRVLMIGNSYTYYNDLWDLLTEVAESGGYTFTVDHVTQGGYYLDQYTWEGDPFAAQLSDLLAENTYDYVFLQEQSTAPINNVERFENGVTALYEKATENGAAVVLYQTWGRQTGSPALSANGWTNKGMTEDLKASYEALAEKLGTAVSPVGTAFYDVHTNHKDINLYDPDTTHPSLEGSLLAAYCHYATLTNDDPRNVTYDAGLSSETTAVLKQAAYDAVFPATAEE